MSVLYCMHACMWSYSTYSHIYMYSISVKEPKVYIVRIASPQLDAHLGWDPTCTRTPGGFRCHFYSGGPRNQWGTNGISFGTSRERPYGKTVVVCTGTAQAVQKSKVNRAVEKKHKAKEPMGKLTLAQVSSGHL